MMHQFEVIKFRSGKRALVRIDTTRYDSFWGFSEFIKWLPD